MKFYQQKIFRPYQKMDSNPYSFKQHQHVNYSYEDSNPNYQQYSESYEEASPSFRKSPIKNRTDYQRQTQPIWDQLYKQGLQSKKSIAKMHQDNKNKIDIECTFHPLVKQSKRYLLPSNSTFLDRVNIWQEHKIQKMVKEKEQNVNNDLKECTFIPKLNRNYIKQKDDDGKGPKFHKTPIKQLKISKNVNPYYTPIKKAYNQLQKTLPKRKLQPHIQLSEAKKMIRTELKKINL